jgi:hypothetical protein
MTRLRTPCPKFNFNYIGHCISALSALVGPNLWKTCELGDCESVTHRLAAVGATRCGVISAHAASLNDRLIAIYFRSPRIRTLDPTINSTNAANTATFTTVSTILSLPKRSAVFILTCRRPEIFPARRCDC